MNDRVVSGSERLRLDARSQTKARAAAAADADLVAALQENERLARQLIALLEGLRAMGHGDKTFHALVLGAEGLAHWRAFLKHEFAIDW
jgi:hypothetical protein